MAKNIAIYSIALVFSLFLALRASNKKNDIKELSKVWFSTSEKLLEVVSYKEKDTAVFLKPLSNIGEYWLDFEGPEDNAAKVRLEKLKAKKAGKKFDSEQYKPKIEKIGFKASDVIQYFIEFVTRLKAVRVIGSKDSLNPSDFGIEEGGPLFSIKTTDGKSLNLQLGKKSYGSSNIYALDLDRNEVILIPEFQLSKIQKPRKKLFESKTLNLNFEDVKTARANVKGQEKKWLMKGENKNSTKYWYDDRAGGEKSTVMSTWMYELRRVKVERYSTPEERVHLSSLEPSGEIYFDEGKASSEKFVFIIKNNEKGKPEYWVKSNFTTVFAKVKSRNFKKFEDQMAKIFP